MIFNITAAIILLSPVRQRQWGILLSCVLIIVGIWIEKGLGFVIPGFIPTPLGDFVQYVPSLNELVICIGIWAFGLLLYTLFLKTAIPILEGRWRRS